MKIFDNQMMAVFSLDLFRQVMCGEDLSLCKYNALTTMLINSGIPFDVSYTPGTRRDAPGIELTIIISPTSTMVFNIALAPGQTQYGSSL